MTVENLWINGKIVKGENKEKKGKDFKYEYDVQDAHFDQLRKCAVMNSTAVFTTSLPDSIHQKLEHIKEKDPQHYEKELALANK